MESCPSCRGQAVPVIYGRPGPEACAQAERGEVILGGCTPSDDTHGCKACGLRFALSRVPGLRSTSETLHVNIVCDFCNTSPLPGRRFRCNVCEDFDVCGKCLAGESFSHPPHPFTEIDVHGKVVGMPGTHNQPMKHGSQDATMHVGITCDICNTSPLTGKRFKCNTCDDFDVCGKCLSGDKFTHPPHAFTELDVHGRTLTRAPLQNISVVSPGAPAPLHKILTVLPGASPLSTLLAPLGFGLLHHLCTSEAGNVWISPFSIATCMGMVAAGATGNSATQSELRAALNHAGLGSEATVLGAFAATTVLASEDPAVRLISSASAWVRSSIHQTYVDSLKKNFGAEAALLTAAGPINDWCSSKTEGLIEKIIEKVDPLDVMILVTAIYFKGSWTQPFKESSTQKSIFSGPGGSMPCMMMSDTRDKMDYGKLGSAHAVRLPYGDTGAYAAVILLPERDDDVSLLNLLSSLNHPSWQALHSSFTPRRVALTLPRFKLDYGIKSLTDGLKVLGIKEAFGDAKNKFDRITDDPDIYLSDVLHKAVCEVNEEGTVAAAVTAAVFKTRGMAPRPAPVIEVRCDRPFLFAIVHVPSSAPLFIGRVSAV